ncbi:FKBP-type peptidyl-prolyl cis-trans isomerase [Okibacterium endophyticum]
MSAGLLVTALTACSASNGSECTPSGEASELIDVAGEFGRAPTVSFPTPIKTDTTQSSVIVEGDGPAITGDQVLNMSWVMYNGSTGDVLQGTAYAEPALYLTSQLLDGMRKGLMCHTEGSRVAVAISPADAFGEDAGSPQIGVEADDTLVLVADIDEVLPAKADGADRPVVESGFPSVVTAADGTPGLTIPDSDPPTELKVATLKQGDGATVESGDQMVVQYTGVLWNEQTVFDSTWENGAPAVFSTDQIVPGLSEALVGKQVGSQVLAVIPPSLGYGDAANGAVPSNSTLIFVVDILGIVG